MSEQAAQAALESSGTLSDLASFLSDTPDTESEEELEAASAEESTGDETDKETDATSDQDDVDPEDPDNGEEEPDEPTTADRKIKVPDRHEDGTVTEIEVTEKELIAGYERQAAFTRKTQALAQRENQAVEFLTAKHEEVKNHYLQQAELAKAAVIQIAGLKTEDELASLASSDPAAWVAETQRQRQISNYLAGLNQQIEGEKQQAKAQADQRSAQAIKQAYETAWQELSKDGIDKPKLQKIYADVGKAYGFSNEELGAVYDHRLVRALKDAAAYRALQAQKPAVMAKAQAAPRMPTKQTPPAQERRDKELDNRFRTGRAKLNDLAAFLR